MTYAETEESSAKTQYTCAACGKRFYWTPDEPHSDGDDDYHPECCPICNTQEGE